MPSAHSCSGSTAAQGQVVHPDAEHGHRVEAGELLGRALLISAVLRWHRQTPMIPFIPMRYTSQWIRPLVIGIALITATPRVAAQTPVPDLTQGEPKDDSHDWTLGPTGARGWIWGWNLETTRARQILITKVENDSPADGVLQAGDVIVGVNGTAFTDDARKAFGSAITEAEKTKNRGRLDLLRWRKGTTEGVTLHLRVLGSYSDTSPEDCSKSKLILEQACRHLAQHGLGDSIAAEINALGLLATGRPEYLDRVKALAHDVGPPTLKLELHAGMSAWTWGFANLFLTEYFLATGDRYVLPAIKEYSIVMSAGQSEVGTWGHGMVVPGSQNALGGYGAINQSGLVCWLSLILAQKCGVNDVVVKKAVEKSHRFFGFYVGKGSIPYGDHAPYYFLHDNNGKTDDHLYPRVSDGCTIDWVKTMKLFRSREHQFPLMLKVPEPTGKEPALVLARQVFDRLEESNHD